MNFTGFYLCTPYTYIVNQNLLKIGIPQCTCSGINLATSFVFFQIKPNFLINNISCLKIKKKNIGFWGKMDLF